MTQANKASRLLDKLRRLASKRQNERELAKLHDRLEKNKPTLVSFEEGQVKILN
jgi:hypothetical protein